MADDVRWLDEREARAWRSLQDLHLRLDAELARRLAAASGLSYPDYAVLVALSEADGGRLRPYELSEAIGWEKSRVSHQVRRMADRGLVAKEDCDTDRRGAVVALTARGRSAVEAAAPGHVAAVRELFVDHLTPAQLDAVADVAQSVLAAWPDVSAAGGETTGAP